MIEYHLNGWTPPPTDLTELREFLTAPPAG